ncbi:MAG: hypothetical protein P4M11_04595 [Candidatus Pacebacteria bacterium]|nr:hypothetical protein [Candidatus Paceibacterota bacterium]
MYVPYNPSSGYKFDTEGNWQFSIDTKTHEADLFDPRVHCGHPQPNRYASPRRDLTFRQGAKAEIKLKAPAQLQVTLEAPNIMVLHTEEGKTEEGWWTMIYNLGFMAKTDSFEFVANFDYNTKSGMRSRYDCVSHCGRTLGSWYKDLRTGKMGCFYAEKIQLFEDEAKKQQASFAQTGAGLGEAVQSLSVQLRDIKYEDLAFLVDKINKQTYDSEDTQF